jgi:hypothetical protein
VNVTNTDRSNTNSFDTRSLKSTLAEYTPTGRPVGFALSVIDAGLPLDEEKLSHPPIPVYSMPEELKVSVTAGVGVSVIVWAGVVVFPTLALKATLVDGVMLSVGA